MSIVKFVLMIAIVSPSLTVAYSRNETFAGDTARVVPESGSWSAAFMRCNMMGLTLPSITSAEEAAEILAVAKRNGEAYLLNCL